MAGLWVCLGLWLQEERVVLAADRAVTETPSLRLDLVRPGSNNPQEPLLRYPRGLISS